MKSPKPSQSRSRRQRKGPRNACQKRALYFIWGKQTSAQLAKFLGICRLIPAFMRKAANFFLNIFDRTAQPTTLRPTFSEKAGFPCLIAKAKNRVISLDLEERPAVLRLAAALV
jgi:hypothetical protein